MAIVHFYEKPGCVGNARQKQLLHKAGHRLVVFDLLQYPWAQAPQTLRAFFGDMPVGDWFNRSAPAIKHGEIDPDRLDEDQALTLMIASPILIRRPLLEADGQRQAGFDTGPGTLAHWLAQGEAKVGEGCPKPQDETVCQR